MPRERRTIESTPAGIRRSLSAMVALVALATASAPEALAQAARGTATLPTIEERTAGLLRMAGFFPLYVDRAANQVWMEIPRFDEEVLYITGLASGLGSNDIGLDRGILQGSRIVKFERAGGRVMMVQPNYQFRSSSTNPAEVGAVRDAFARSVLWGFPVAAETGTRALVDMTDFLMRDATNIAPRLRPGSYRLETGRSAVYLPMTMNFPQNTELEVELTFVSQPGGGGGVPPFFEGVGSVAANGEAASLRVHHSLVALPDDGYTSRRFDPRSGYGAVAWQDYSVPLGQPMTQQFIRRHRLEKRNPAAPVSEPVKPIVYYLDPGAPEPVRTALLAGARWWNQAFEAAGYRNAFQVEMLPEGASPHDVRYNVINWVHRSTRGWSTGASVTDPRTGEILKGVVTLGSLRIRQDYMLAEGLLSPYRTGDETPPELAEWALARIRQLSAHEVGHTLGLGHNYYNSRAGRISVMDYPHPLVTLRPDGSLDYSQVYENGIGEWDRVAITWGYQHFTTGTDEQAALARVLGDAWERDVRYMTNQDVGLHSRVDQWANGTDAAAELNRMMDVRRAAMSRFGENAIKRGMPMATIEEVLVPLYLHHRYQVESATSVLGGIDYVYAMRGDGRIPTRPAPAADQRAALRALLATLRPAELTLPGPLLDRIPPRPPGFGRSRELFPRYTGGSFDAFTPSVVAADMVLAGLLDGNRAARLVQQNALDASLPGLEEILDQIHAATFGAPAANGYEAEVKRGIERIYAERLMELAGGAQMPQVRALATLRLTRLQDAGLKASTEAAAPEAAHQLLLAQDIRRFLDRPMAPMPMPSIPAPPPGAPIGDPGMDWLGGRSIGQSWASPAGGGPDRRPPGFGWFEDLEPACSMEDHTPIR